MIYNCHMFFIWNFFYCFYTWQLYHSLDRGSWLFYFSSNSLLLDNIKISCSGKAKCNVCVSVSACRQFTTTFVPTTENTARTTEVASRLLVWLAWIASISLVTFGWTNTLSSIKMGPKPRPNPSHGNRSSKGGGGEVEGGSGGGNRRRNHYSRGRGGAHRRAIQYNPALLFFPRGYH